MHSLVQPNAWVVLRLPNESLKILQVAPNTIISLPKYGTFPSNLLIGRPYYKTYELLDRLPGHKDSSLRIVTASELHADTIAEENAATKSSQNANAGNDHDESIPLGGDGVEYQLVGPNNEVIMRSNRETIDSSAHQTLTMAEIEALKREGTDAGKDLIAKLMASHLGIDQKTAFSLAKYKLLKTKKYLRRFTVLPVDVPMLTRWIAEEKDTGKILELREEMLALVGSWANVHFASELPTQPNVAGGRWLVVDETGGLLVAALAERMDILHPVSPDDTISAEGEEAETPHYNDQPLATSNTLTLIHANAQPNISLLKYFSYDPTTASPPTRTPHPLSTHLHTLSWLQLISPSLDTTYSTSIPLLTPDELSSLKSGKRGTYYRKLRRHTRVKNIVSSTQAGNFDGLVVASHMDPVSILRHTIPLLRGGAQVSIYSPTIEPLVALADVYSTSRRTAFIQAPPESFLALLQDTGPNSTSIRTSIPSADSNATTNSTPDQPLAPPPNPDTWPGSPDFPLNPTLLLSTSVQSCRLRPWQVLPGRTHPSMTGKGGAEGYLFTATRVVPARGRVEARGKFGKKRVELEGAGRVGGVGEGQGADGKNGEAIKREVDVGEIGKRDGEPMVKRQKSVSPALREEVEERLISDEETRGDEISREYQPTFKLTQ
ncbi:tRNA (adenine-N(1)-)-methyltransferase non-catalytic subunit trm6 [Diplocarpon rosae]|nr:tRNA (adenine-N(1)-)-methyltransferase non-catalytic subunit trm6 [Diplocarpon rosae]